MAGKREYGTGSISWLTNRKVRLRFRLDVDGKSVRRTKVVVVPDRDHGGRGEAAAALAAFKVEIEEEANRPSTSSITFADALVAYREHCERIGREPNTILGYELAAKRIPPELGKKQLLDVEGKDLDSLYGDLAARGLSDNTIRNTHAIVSASLNWTKKKRKWITTNPAEEATPPVKIKTQREPLEVMEVARLAFAAAKPNAHHMNGDPVLAMAILLASLTGARRGELCGLKWSDLNKEKRTIKIQRQLVPCKGGQSEKPPKSDLGVRTIHIGSEGLGLIEQYRSVMQELLSREPDGWLLSHDAGVTPLRAKSLGDGMSRVGRDIGLKISTHSFRKVSATQTVASGVDVDTAARRLGHTLEVMFDHYLLGANDKAIAAADIIEGRLVSQGLPLGDIMGEVMRNKNVDAQWQPKELRIIQAIEVDSEVPTATPEVHSS